MVEVGAALGQSPSPQLSLPGPPSQAPFQKRRAGWSREALNLRWENLGSPADYPTAVCRGHDLARDTSHLSGPISFNFA